MSYDIIIVGIQHASLLMFGYFIRLYGILPTYLAVGLFIKLFYRIIILLG